MPLTRTPNTQAIWVRMPGGSLINLQYVVRVSIGTKNNAQLIVKYPISVGNGACDVITCADNAAAIALREQVATLLTAASNFTDLS